MAFIKDLEHDEIRDGFFVSSDRKKVWQRWLEIWQEVDRICRKHGLKYWAAYGTLLGAARHKGFIPWDEDLDLCMMRPDYNRFCEIVEDELRGGVFEVEHIMFSNFRITHSQTTMIDNRDLHGKHESKGLMIEIFPFDVAPDGTHNGFFSSNALNELLGAIYNYPAIVEHVQSGRKTINDWSVIETLRGFGDLQKQYEFLNIYAEGVFDWSSNVNWIEKFVIDKHAPNYKKEWFRETIYLPFELVEMPVPIDYEKILTSYYGDWHKLICDGITRLGVAHSVDIPYREFLERVDLNLMFPKSKS